MLTGMVVLRGVLMDDGKIVLIVIAVLALLIIANIGFIVIAARNDKINE